ncbi:MAG: hypothetical protein M1816_006015 [Peltula sp. TS41687]|nr:MAG: hypothetical protein M1816_006015 [Peltula sp. TS41687]
MKLSSFALRASILFDVLLAVSVNGLHERRWAIHEALHIRRVHSSSTLTATDMAGPSMSNPPSVPTPVMTVYPLPGTYIIPASTVTLDSPAIVPTPMATKVNSGVYTFDGLTTVVSGSSTIICPYTSAETSGSVAVTKVYNTNYICPSSGTYTIHPMTTTVSESTIWALPVPTSYPAGTYIQPETTVTATETNQLVYCPFSSEGFEAAVTSTEESIPTSTVTVRLERRGSPSTSSDESSSSSYPVLSPRSPSHNPPPSGHTLGGGSKWCMTYTPYTSTGQCKTASQVDDDISLIASKGFRSIRIYGTDCSTLPNVGAAVIKHGLKLVAGVFIDGSGICSNTEKQVSDIISWAKQANHWSTIELLAIGNEALANNFVSAKDLASFMAKSKTRLRAAGYAGPVTTAEPSPAILAQHASTLCPVLDVVGANIHPFFNSDTCAEEAGDFVANQLNDLGHVCPGGKPALCLETGWPSSGKTNGQAVPGKEQQKRAIQSIMRKVGGRSAVFSYGDDGWKNPGPLGVENWWGCGHLF